MQKREKKRILSLEKALSSLEGRSSQFREEKALFYPFKEKALFYPFKEKQSVQRGKGNECYRLFLSVEGSATRPPPILEGIIYMYLKLYILSEHFPPPLFLHVVCCVES